MKISLYFDSTQEFSLFICSVAALDFRTMPKIGVDLSRCLPAETYCPFLDHVSSVRVVNVTYVVEANSAMFKSEAHKVMNYMLNDVQMEHDSIMAICDDETTRGSQQVREYIETLPRSFGLKVGWVTDHQLYVFHKNN